MSELPELVKDLALILVVAGFVTLISRNSNNHWYLGYIVAGFLVSPHMPYTMSVVDQRRHTNMGGYWCHLLIVLIGIRLLY